MTEYQKYANAFEDLSEQIVSHIFKDIKSTITKTTRTKDGGYDIVAECTYQGLSMKTYFECKMRSSNMNLRDIAANVIIAFNEGAVAMVALTNHSYTPQANEQLSEFIDKTVLNIKIIVGEDIHQLSEKSSIVIPKTLMRLINKKRNNKMYLNEQVLRIDLSKHNLHTQILNNTRNITYTARRWHGDKCVFNTAKTILSSSIGNNFLIVTGPLGVGKRAFVDSIVLEDSYTPIRIQGSLYDTQEHALIEILMDIWGLPSSKIIEDFELTHVEDVIERIGNTVTDKSVLSILRSILSVSSASKAISERYNLIICNYIIEIMKRNHNSRRHIFIVEHLPYARDEVLSLLLCLIRKASANKLPVVIIEETEEYTSQKSLDLRKTLGLNSSFSPVELKSFTDQHAVSCILSIAPAISEIIAINIINHVGTRHDNLLIFINHLVSSNVNLSDSARISKELSLIEKNSIPSILSKAMKFYREYYSSDIFDLLYLFNGRFNERLCEDIDINIDALDSIMKGGIIVYQQGYYLCSNSVVKYIINEWGDFDIPRLRLLAKKVLAKWVNVNDTKIRFEKACLYKYIGEYSYALGEIMPLLEDLRTSKQYSMLCDVIDVCIEICKSSSNYVDAMEWMVEYLSIMVITKSLYTLKAQDKLSELGNYMSGHFSRDIPYYIRMAYDFCLISIEFRTGNYDTKTPIGEKMRAYVQIAQDNGMKSNHGDWLGNICERYALFIKESEGYDEAMEQLEYLIKYLPESPRLKQGYLSHKACMCLHNHPERAYDYYEQIIDIGQSQKYWKPSYHAIVDKVMCKLLSGKLLDAETQALSAIEICESNSILDEWGRALNILGCVYVQRNMTNKAEKCFKDSCELMKISGYKLYCWRSQLNFIYIGIKHGLNADILLKELDDAYECFMNLQKEKIQRLLDEGTNEIISRREYHALLSFSLYRTQLNGKYDHSILKDLHFGSLKKRFTTDLRKLYSNDNTALSDSLFYKNGMIMNIG